MAAGHFSSSPNELSAAAGLLLLLQSSSFSTPSSASSRSSNSSRSVSATSGSWFNCVEEECHSSSSTSSSTVSDHEVCRQFEVDPLRILSLAARCIDTKRKVVTKSRSAVLKRSITKTITSIQNQMEDPDPSCISSSSTTALTVYSSPTFSGSSSSCAANSINRLPPTSPVSATSAHASIKPVSTRMKFVAVSEGISALICRSASVKKRAEAILHFLSDKGRTSEIKIRAVLGDSPDTSKALRMLVKLHQVKRSGIGGRQSPYLYRVSESLDGSVL